MANRANSPIAHNSGRARALADLRRRADAGDTGARQILAALRMPVKGGDALSATRRASAPGAVAAARDGIDALVDRDYDGRFDG